MGFGIKWSWGHAGSYVGAGTQLAFLSMKWIMWASGSQGFPMRRHWALFQGENHKNLCRLDTQWEYSVGTRCLKFSQKTAAVSTGCILCITLSYYIAFTLPNITNIWFSGKDPDAGKDWGQEEKESTEDEMAGWHHWLNRHEFEQTPGAGEGQGGLACYNSWGHRKSDTTEWLNNITWYYFVHLFICLFIVCLSDQNVSISEQET